MSALYIIGIGLNNKSLTHQGNALIESSDEVYIENYTSKTGYNLSELENFVGKTIKPVGRYDVEGEENHILNSAETKKVSLLIIGDIFAATTHQDLYIRALKKKIHVTLVNNASIFNHIGNTGIDQYKFGRVTSLVFTEPNWFPLSPYENIMKNQSIGLHTICLFDIKTAEPTKEDILTGNKKPQKPRFMNVKEAIDYIETADKKTGNNVLKKDKKIIIISNAGLPNEKITYDTPQKIKQIDCGEPLYTMIIPGNISHYEKENIETIVKHHNIY